MATSDVVDIMDWDVHKGDDGMCVAVVKYRNDSDLAEKRTLKVSLKAGGKSAEQEIEIDAPPRVPKEVKVNFDLPYKKFRRKGELVVDLA